MIILTDKMRIKSKEEMIRGSKLAGLFPEAILLVMEESSEVWGIM